MEQRHTLLFISLMLVVAIAAAGCTGTSPAVNNSSITTNVTSTPVPASYTVNLMADHDFLYLSLPAAGADDTMTVTASVYENGNLVKSGVPVAFNLDDERFAKLGQKQVMTNDNGTASVIVSAQPSGAYPLTYPYDLKVTATANGATGSVTVPMSRHESLSGRSIDKEGNPVSGATVTLRFNATNDVVRAPGNPTITNGDGRYNFTCLPVDMGNIKLVVQKGSLTNTIPVDLMNISKNVT